MVLRAANLKIAMIASGNHTIVFRWLAEGETDEGWRKVTNMKAEKVMLRNSQNLRKNMTKEERHLWYDFLKNYPVQFKRQFIIGHYIVDFYCDKAKLVLELDGSQHCEPEALEYDRNRTIFLEEKGLYVFRISNLDVMRNFRGVCEAIDMTVRYRV